MLVLPPEVAAVLAGIEIVKSASGGPEAGCERDGNPRVGYPSAACARRGVLLLSWRDGRTLTGADAVYECRQCGCWHHTRRKWLLVGDRAALVA